MEGKFEKNMERKKVLLLLSNGFEAYEASAFTDVFGWNEAEGSGGVDLVSCGLHKNLKCTWNFQVTPEAVLSDISTEVFDALAIPGGFEEAGYYDDAFSEAFLSVIRAFDTDHKDIASICVGALPIAKSDVLKGRKGTTYHLKNGYRKEQMALLGVEVVDQLIVIDRNIITSSCPSTAVDVAFLLLQRLTSCANMLAVKRCMGFAE